MQGAGQDTYVLTPEDVILAKLDRSKQPGHGTGNVSERQSRDVLGVIKTEGVSLNVEYLLRRAGTLDVVDLMEQALEDLKK